jgi:hypothetical protein
MTMINRAERRLELFQQEGRNPGNKRRDPNNLFLKITGPAGFAQRRLTDVLTPIFTGREDGSIDHMEFDPSQLLERPDLSVEVRTPKGRRLEPKALIGEKPLDISVLCAHLDKLYKSMIEVSPGLSIMKRPVGAGLFSSFFKQPEIKDDPSGDFRDSIYNFAVPDNRIVMGLKLREARELAERIRKITGDNFRLPALNEWATAYDRVGNKIVFSQDRVGVFQGIARLAIESRERDKNKMSYRAQWVLTADEKEGASKETGVLCRLSDRGEGMVKTYSRIDSREPQGVLYLVLDTRG